MSDFLGELRDAKRANEEIPIYTHGEKELRSLEVRMREGIDVDVSTVAEMMNICKYLGMDSAEYLGEIDVSGARAGTYDTVYK